MNWMKKTPPTRSPVFSVLWHFAVKRQAVYLRRLQGLPAPWTDDPVIRYYRFTNAFRAADRVSQALIRLAYREPTLDDDSLFLRVLLFKIFNKIETWDALESSLGPIVASDFAAERFEDVLADLRRRRIPIYSSAYIMPSGGVRGQPKHGMHLQLIARMLNDDVPRRIRASGSLEEVYQLLLSYPSFGPFLAFQYSIDLNYTTLLNHNEGDFVVAGPGALDGLSKCFTSLGDYTPEDTIRWLADIQDEEFERHGLHFGGLFGRPLQPIDVQNLFCEVSKYTRVSHPDVPGVAGRTRIKRRFNPAAERVPIPFFPPKWGINDTALRWLERPSKPDKSQPTMFMS